MTKSIAHGNNVTTNVTKDDWNRPRPKVIATSGALNPAGSPQEWTTGTYAYDGSGNVIRPPRTPHPLREHPWSATP